MIDYILLAYLYDSYTHIIVINPLFTPLVTCIHANSQHIYLNAAMSTYICIYPYHLTPMYTYTCYIGGYGRVYRQADDDQYIRGYLE